MEAAMDKVTDTETLQFVISNELTGPFARLLAFHVEHGVISDSEWDITREIQDQEVRPSIIDLIS